MSHDEQPGRGLWIGLAIGAPLMAYGSWELIHHSDLKHSWAVTRLLLGGLLLHDFVVVPIVLAIVWLVGRALPLRATNAVRAGVLGTLLVIAVGWAALRGYGTRADNPTIHPLDATTAVLTAVGLVWIAAGAVLIVNLTRGRARRESPNGADREPDRDSARSTPTRPPG